MNLRDIAGNAEEGEDTWLYYKNVHICKNLTKKMVDPRYIAGNAEEEEEEEVAGMNPQLKAGSHARILRSQGGGFATRPSGQFSLGEAWCDGYITESNSLHSMASLSLC